MPYRKSRIHSRQPPADTAWNFSGVPMPYAAVDVRGGGIGEGASASVSAIRNAGMLSAVVQPTVVGTSSVFSVQGGIRSFYQTAIDGLNYLSLGTDSRLKGVPFTYLFVASTDNTASNSALICSSLSPLGGAGRTYVRINSSGKLELLKAGTASIVTGNKIWSQTRPFVGAVSYDGTVGTLYVNGTLDAQASNAQTFTNNAAQPFALGATSVGALESQKCKIGMFVMWPLVLPVGLLCSLTANPWQLYEPSRRRIISQSSAVATTWPGWVQSSGGWF